MRINLPVTQNNYDFPADQTLISVTDLKGRITYCNNNFVSVSGFAADELLGQAHNILRHPDMPAEAFRDMWHTIAVKGKPWSALVKNRRKNGDHYWVRANATPMRDGARIIGFLSVRTKPAPEEIAAFDALYARMREQTEAGRLKLGLEEGRVVRRGRVFALVRALKPGLRGEVFWVLGLASLLPLAASLAAAPLWVSLLLALAATFGLGGWLGQRALLPLLSTQRIANQLAAGDLSGSVAIKTDGADADLVLALAQINVGVRTVVRDVRHEVINLLGGTQEIAAGNTDLAARTEAQANQVARTAASLAQINASIQQAAHMAVEGAQQADDTAAVARRSHAAVESLGQTMAEISDSSKRIGDIVRVIEAVAFQTNILALNAAVEAARAGDMGRSFAVVASEVRALAQRTSQAASEIRTLIDESRQRVAQGSLRSGEAQARMGEALQSVERVSDLLGRISQSVQQQSLGTAEVSEAVTDLDGITQQNAAMVEQLSAASMALNSQVRRVSDTIRVFKLTPSEKTLAEVDLAALRAQASAGTLRLSADTVDFERILAAHQQVRISLRNAINRRLRLDADKFRRDDGCELGRWIYAGGQQRLGHLAQFQQLVEQNRQFHHTAGAVADAINQRNYEQAEQLVATGSAFHHAGQAVVAAIRALRTAVEGQ